MRKHFFMYVPMRVFPSGLTDEGRPVLNVGRAASLVEQGPDLNTEEEMSRAPAIISLFPECGCNVPVTMTPPPC